MKACDASVQELSHTEGDTRVLLTDLVTVVVCEEHVGGQATLGSVGV